MKKYTLRTFASEAVLVVIAAVFAVPFYIIINTAFAGETSRGNALQPSFPLNMSNVQVAWAGGLGPAILNSIFVTVVSVAIIIALSSAAGYFLARVATRWSKTWYFLFLVGLMLPLQLATLPLYVIIRDSGLLGTLWSLILVYSAAYLPFSIFLYTLFIRALPTEFEEAAVVDGASPSRVFRSVVFPLVRPVTVTIAILNGIGIYNDFFTPLLYLSGSGQETVTVAINGFVSQYATQWPVVFAGLLLASLPILIAFLALQKQIIGGFAGGLKG